MTTFFPEEGADRYGLLDVEVSGGSSYSGVPVQRSPSPDGRLSDREGRLQHLRELHCDCPTRAWRWEVVPQDQGL